MKLTKRGELMNQTAQADPQAAGGKPVSVPSVSQDDVDEARDALGGGDGNRAFSDAVDGTSPEGAKEKEEISEVLNTPRPDDVIKKLIVNAIEKIDEVDKQRKLLNAQRSEVIEGLKVRGIDIDAFEFARKRIGQDAQKLQNMDLTNVLVAQALGQDFQSDWVDE